jgi:2-dehydro-3-deoxygluconokinase
LADSPLRESRSANTNEWSACLRNADGFKLSRHYEITAIIDGVGCSDSFASGLIAGLALYDDRQESLESAGAASYLKHSISGDFNRLSASEAQNLMGGDSSGRAKRESAQEKDCHRWQNVRKLGCYQLGISGRKRWTRQEC